MIQIYDSDPTALRDNEDLWMQTMDWLIDCPEAVDPDCDDTDPTVYPGAEDLCDGVDNDCDGEIDEAWDEDGDGDGDIHPGAAEVCDGLDQDCDGTVDEDDVCVGEECVEEPPEECLSVWQALSRGWLSVESNETDVGIAFTNEGIYDICLDGMALYTSLDTQDFFLDAAIVDLPAEIVPGDTYTAWYGSWTTENDVYSPYLGEPAWWCAESRTAAGAAVAFGTYGVDVDQDDMLTCLP